MENPYDTPSAAPAIDGDLRRPVGVSILSALTAILGFVLVAAFVVLLWNWQENNEIAIRRRQAPSIFWFMIGSSIVLAFVASVGMWRGRKWGWWIACSGLVLYVIQNVGSVVMANVSDVAPSFATFLAMDSLKFVLRGMIFVGILTYWLRTNVRQYFHVERTGRIKAIILAGVAGIGITVIITVVLQSIFLLRMRYAG